MPQLFNNRKLARRRSSEAAVSLWKRRAWFADADEGRDDPDKGTGEADSKYKPADLEGAQKIIKALEKRLEERDGTISSLNDRLTAIEKANRDKLEQDGNFKELASQRAAEVEKLRPSAERAEALDKVIRDINEARIKALPETVRALVPTDYAPEKLMNWLTANESLLKAAPQPEFDMGAGGGKSKASSTPELTAEEIEFAKAVGMPLDRYAELKKKKGQPIEDIGAN